MSKGGPRAAELIARLQSEFGVYELEPDVFDVYADTEEPVLIALEEVTSAWRTYLEVGAPEAGWIGTEISAPSTFSRIPF